MPYIPPRIDLFAILILLGIVQGCLLCFFFFSNSKGDQFPNRFQGGALLVITLVMTDVWLGYTNYMMKVLWLNDFTEPCNLCIGPFFTCMCAPDCGIAFINGNGCIFFRQSCILPTCA